MLQQPYIKKVKYGIPLTAEPFRKPCKRSQAVYFISAGWEAAKHKRCFSMKCRCECHLIGDEK